MRPYDAELEFRSIIIGTTRSPGSCIISGHDRPKNWDVKEAKGQTGASTALNGDPIGQFEVTFYLADDSFEADGTDDFSRWEEFQKLVESTTAGPKPKALSVYHPDLALNRFTEVVNGGVGGMSYDGRGGASVKVKFLEYKPPKPAKPKKAVAAPGAPTRKPDPNAFAKQELDNLLTEAKKP